MPQYGEATEQLLAIKYLVKDTDPHVYVAARDNEGESWVIEHMGHVLSKETFEFIYEPMPSSRSENFIKETRFDTAEQAYECYLKYFNKVIIGARI